MKTVKFSIVILTLLIIPFNSTYIWGIPADPSSTKIKLADGSILTLYLHGDEFEHYTTTEDGYTVVKNNTGNFVYAIPDNTNGLRASEYKAKDISFRSQAEITFLSTTPKKLLAKKSPAMSTRTMSNKQYIMNGLLTQKRAMPSNFKGVIILAQFNDKSFQSTNANEEINSMVNQQNYTENGASGSVRDYFYDNSMGKFDPQFTIVGPVTLDYSQKYAQGSDNGQELVHNACVKADPFVDFSQFDLDGDKRVDMIYVIFAGHGSNVSGNDADLIWPHAYALGSWQVRLDGVYCNRYACSTELQGSMNSTRHDGIGTICHEFGHVLGLPDFYDTDYEKNGSAPHPDRWSVMASGSYLNNSYTPCGYSAFERYVLGWVSPTMLENQQTCNLQALNTSNQAYRINSAVKKEFFILENRQQTGWDKYLPGHGMLIFRVDSTNAQVWANNIINNNPDHVYYELLRADNQNSATLGNPFPGLLNKTSISDETTPGLRSWNGTPTGVEIANINETNSSISFNFNKATISKLVEDFEDSSKKEWAVAEITGNHATWKLNNAIIEENISSQSGNGNKAVLVKRGSLEMTSDVTGKIMSIGCYMAMQNSVATYKIEYSMDQGQTWNKISENNFTVNSTQKEYSSYDIGKEGVFRLRITVVSPAAAYIDDVTINMEGNPTSIICFPQIDTMNRLPYINDRVIHYYIKSEMERTFTIYDQSGKIIQTGKGETGWNTQSIDSQHMGFILFRQGADTNKLWIK